MLPPWDVQDVLAVRASARGWRGSRPSASLVTHATSASSKGLALGLGPPVLFPKEALTSRM